MTRLAKDTNGFPIQALGLGDTVIVDALATASNSADLAQSGVMRVIATTKCHIRIGQGVTAATTDAYFVPDQIEYFRVEKGDRISVIKGTLEADGKVYATFAA